MKLVRIGCRVAIAVTALAMSIAKAGAAEAPAAFSLHYQPPAGCPTRSSLVAQILARSDAIREVDSDAVRRFVLEIDVHEGSADGVLLIRETDGNQSRREVSGGDCVAVVEASALIVALILDPRARTGPLPADSPALSKTALGALSAEPERRTTATPNQARQQNVGTKPAKQPRANSSPRHDSPLRDVMPNERPSKRRRADWQWGVAAGPVMLSAFAPTIAPGAQAGVRLMDWGDSIVAPILGVDGKFAVSSTTETSAGDASFALLAGRMWACPIRLPAMSSPFGARTCGAFEAGLLRAESSGVFDAKDQSAPWFAAGAFERLEWLATSAVGFELEAGALFPAFRDRFVFRPGVEAHEVPAAGFQLGMAAAVWLP